MFEWTETQAKRLKELDAALSELHLKFKDASTRGQAFQALARKLVRHGREKLQDLRNGARRPALCRLETRLVEALVSAGFVQVATPTIMSRGLLDKMSIDAGHPLTEQIFWLDRDRCLRPMLAPHLYYVLKDLIRLWEPPIAIFEIGPCFRKESHGQQHASEFTMLNLVEMGLAEADRKLRLETLTATVMAAAGISEFDLVATDSEVYGETIDVVAGPDSIELGSTAMGPHALDRAWRINLPWVGAGFGLERILMIAEKGSHLKRMGKSITYLDGVRLNL